MSFWRMSEPILNSRGRSAPHTQKGNGNHCADAWRRWGKKRAGHSLPLLLEDAGKSFGLI